MSDGHDAVRTELAAGVLRLRDEMREMGERIEAIGLALLKSNVQPDAGEDWVAYAGRVAGMAAVGVAAMKAADHLPQNGKSSGTSGT